MAIEREITVTVEFKWWFKWACYALAIAALGGRLHERALDWVIVNGINVR